MWYSSFLRLSIVFSLLKSNVRQASAAHPQNGHLNPVAFNRTISWKDETVFDSKLHLFIPFNVSFYQRLDESSNTTSRHYQLRHEASMWRIDLVKDSDFLGASCPNVSSFNWEDLDWSWYNVNNTLLKSAHVAAMEIISEREDTGKSSRMYQIVVPILVLLLLVLIVVVSVMAKKYRVDSKDQPQPKNLPTLREVDGLTMSQSFKADEYMQAKTVQEILHTDDSRNTPDSGYIVMDRRKR